MRKYENGKKFNFKLINNVHFLVTIQRRKRKKKKEKMQAKKKTLK